jgi:DnaJ-domain-containing protein 1
MEEHRGPNCEIDHPKKRGWWSCQLCGCSHFHGDAFCGGCGTPKAAAAQEPPSKLLEPLWREKEEKRRAADTAYRDWCRAESLNIERRSLADRISPARRAEYEQRIAECKAKKAAYYRASAVFHDAGRKYKAALLRWQHDWARSATNAKTTLGVATNATEEEIKSAYRRAAKLYHPDRAEGNGLAVEEAAKAFRQIQEAYEILCSVFVLRVRS